ncbi:MAG: transposase domain-containing protein [Saprospiraceae bacterium]|nr:transposase domain-containing protein [Saprospiraceae bacterium]
MCKINDIDPHRWLTDVYLRIDNHNIRMLDELLPTKTISFYLSNLSLPVDLSQF